MHLNFFNTYQSQNGLSLNPSAILSSSFGLPIFDCEIETTGIKNLISFLLN